MEIEPPRSSFLNNELIHPGIELLRNQIDFSKVPFSDRGSRMMVFLNKDEHRLDVKLAERLIHLNPDIEAYLHRPPLVKDFSLIDQDGKQISFDQTISYPHAIFFSTGIGELGITFAEEDALAIGLPPNQICGLKFYVPSHQSETNASGGMIKSYRDLSYVANCEILINRIVPDKQGCWVSLVMRTSQDRTVILKIVDKFSKDIHLLPFSRLCEDSKERWENWFKSVPPVKSGLANKYAYAWWVMANNLVSPRGNVSYESMMPAKGKYVGMWLWDNAMHALAYRHIDVELARNQIKVILGNQLPNGMLPDAIYDQGVVAEINHPIRAEVTKPPILAWSALKIHEIKPDLHFLEEIYPSLVRWNAWWFEHNDEDRDGIIQYNHPYSSGLDDNPLWDIGMPVESPDINTYLSIQMDSLGRIAMLLGKESEARHWQQQSQAMVDRMIKHMWDEDLGIFNALINENPIGVLTPFNLFPLWTGKLPKPIRGRLLQHLTNPYEFWGQYRIPSVAYRDPTHEPATMWRGPVWVNVNYFIIEAFRKVGEHSLADELTQKTLDLISGSPGITEYYSSQTGASPESAASAFGWSAAVFIDLAISASEKDLF